jgi:hypothetical protein
MKPLGEQSFERDNFSIHYKVLDDSFSHEFGTQKQTRWEIISAQYYITEVDCWIDASLIETRARGMTSYIERLVENHYEGL